jgi:PD-(D/E)XK nuclease superfamily
VRRSIASDSQSSAATYLRLADKPLGLLLNFNVVHLREGIKRVLNNKYQLGIAASQY